MDKQTGFGAALTSGVSAIVDNVLSYLPQIIGAVALLIIGWLLARLPMLRDAACGRSSA